MKKLLLLSFFITMGMFAQEAGKVGQKLDNELTVEKVTHPKVNDVKKRTNDKNTDVSATNPDQKRGNNNNGNGNNNGNVPKTQPQYNWNDKYDYGYSEVFLRIPENDVFSVTLDDQNITTPTGKYRFFDVIPGRNMLQIYQKGRLIYKVRLTVPQNKRMILDFFSNEGLYLLESQNLYNYNNGNYYDTWNHVWNDYYGNNQDDNYNDWDPYYGVNNNNPNNYHPHNQNNPYNNYQNNSDYNNPQHNNPQHNNPQHNNPQNNYGNNNNQWGNQHQGNNYYAHQAMSTQDFAQFKSAVKQQSFEDTKLQMIKSLPQTNWFTSEQIKDLMGLFSFDDNRLEVAKFGYDRCVDPQNFYTTYTVLTFDDSKNDLMEYVAGKGRK